MEDIEIAELAKALSSETRVAIVRLLTGGPLCVNALAERLGVSPSAVSQHLRALKMVRLVGADRRGYYVHYSLCPPTLERLSLALSSLAPVSPVGNRCCDRDTSAATRSKEEDNYG